MKIGKESTAGGIAAVKQWPDRDHLLDRLNGCDFGAFAGELQGCPGSRPPPQSVRTDHCRT